MNENDENKSVADSGSGEDETLAKVFLELAELKRSIAPQGAGELSLHSEVLRLRDDLNKAQSMQELRAELNRIKEQMERTGQARPDHRRDAPELLANLSHKLDAALFGTGAGEEISNLEILVADVNELKEKLLRSEQKNAESFTRLSEDLAERCAVIIATETESDEDIALLMEDLAAVHERVSAIAGDEGEESGMLGALMREVRQIKTDVSAVKDELALLRAAAPALDAVASLSAELSAVKRLISGTETDDGLLDAVLSLKSELADLKRKGAKPSPDDILAEIRSLGDRLNVVGGEADKNPRFDEVLCEIKLLSDRLFAVTMANVVGADGQTGYESYNNLILDELNSLREELARLKGARDQGSGDKDPVGVALPCDPQVAESPVGVALPCDPQVTESPVGVALQGDPVSAEISLDPEKTPSKRGAKKRKKPDIESILLSAANDIFLDDLFLKSEAEADAPAALTKSETSAAAKKTADQLILEELTQNLGGDGAARKKAEKIIQEILPEGGGDAE